MPRAPQIEITPINMYDGSKSWMGTLETWDQGRFDLTTGSQEDLIAWGKEDAQALGLPEPTVTVAE